MIVATVNLPDRSTVLVVVIEKDNLGRMQKGDPITLESIAKGGKLMQKIHHPNNFSILIAYEENQPELYAAAASGNLVELLRYLERNRGWDPKTDGQRNVVDLSKGVDAEGSH